MTEELYYICIDKQLQRWWEGGLGLNIYTIPDMQKAPSRMKIQDRLENSKFRTLWFLRILLHSTYVSISSDFVRENSSCVFLQNLRFPNRIVELLWRTNENTWCLHKNSKKMSVSKCCDLLLTLIWWFKHLTSSSDNILESRSYS